MPSAQPNFLTKRLNVWVNADSPWMDMRLWDACADPKLSIESSPARSASWRVDLASNIDIAAKSLFRGLVDETNEGRRGRAAHALLRLRPVLPARRRHRGIDNSQYKGWARSGHLIATDGNVIDQNEIQDDLRLDKSSSRSARSPTIRSRRRSSRRSCSTKDSRWSNGRDGEELLGADEGSRGARRRAGRFHHDGGARCSLDDLQRRRHVDKKDNVFPNKQTSKNKDRRRRRA
jgi:hypothetical protein